MVCTLLTLRNVATRGSLMDGCSSFSVYTSSKSSYHILLSDIPLGTLYSALIDPSLKARLQDLQLCSCS